MNYNFYPTFYRENDKDSLVIDLGGKRYIFPDYAKLVNFTNQNHFLLKKYYTELKKKQLYITIVYYTKENQVCEK